MANNAPTSSKLGSGLNIFSAGLDGLMRGLGINSHLSSSMLQGMSSNNNPRTASPSEQRDDSPLDRVYVDGVGREDTSTYRDAVRVVKDSERLAATDQVEAIRRLDTGFIKLATFVQGEFTKIRTSIKDHATNINKLADQNLQLQRRQRALDDQIKFLSSQQRNGVGGKDNGELDILKRRMAALEARKPEEGGGGGGGGLPISPWWRRPPPATAPPGTGAKPGAKPVETAPKGKWGGRLGNFGRGMLRGGAAGLVIGGGAALLGYEGLDNPLEGDNKITQSAIDKYGIEVVTAARQKYGSWYTSKNPMMQANRNDLIWSERYVNEMRSTPPSTMRGPAWQRQGEPSAQNMDRKTFNTWLQQSQTGVAPGYGFSSAHGSRQGNPFTSGAGLPSAGGFGDNRTFRPSGGGGTNATGGARSGSGGSRPLNEEPKPWDYSMNQGSTTFNGKVIEGGDPRLATLRSPFAQELADKPDLKRQLVASIDAEDPRGAQVYLQEVMNRAASRGDTLEKTLNLQRGRDKGGYYPRETISQVENRKYSAEGLMKYDKELNYVLGGGHHSVDGIDTSHVTGNASGNVGVGKLIYTNPRTNERYGLETPDANWPNKIRNTRVNATGGAPSGLGQTHPNPARPYPSGQGVGSLMNVLRGPSGATGPGGGTGATAQRGDVAGRPDLRGKNMTDLFKSGTERLYHQGGQVQGVDASVMRLIKDASKDLPEGYRVEMISGKDARSKGTTNHPNGLAMDTIIYDANNREVPHDRGGPGMAHYERLYQSVNERGKILYPGKEYLWGGTWISDAAGPGDPMHIQLKANVHKSSQSSGAYNPDRGAHGHKFEPYLMSDKERTNYKNKIRDRATEEYSGNKTATAPGPAAPTANAPPATTTAPPSASPPSATSVATPVKKNEDKFTSNPTGFSARGFVMKPENITKYGATLVGDRIYEAGTDEGKAHGYSQTSMKDVYGLMHDNNGINQIGYNPEVIRRNAGDKGYKDWLASTINHEMSHAGADRVLADDDKIAASFPEATKHRDFEELRQRLQDRSNILQKAKDEKLDLKTHPLGKKMDDINIMIKDISGDIAKKEQKTPQEILNRANEYHDALNNALASNPKFAKAPYGYNMVTGKPNPEPAPGLSTVKSSNSAGTKGTRLSGAGVAFATGTQAGTITGGPPEPAVATPVAPTVKTPIPQPSTGGAISGQAIVYNPEMETTRIPGPGVVAPVDKPTPTPGIGSRRTGRPTMQNFPDATDVTQPTSGKTSLVTEHIPGKAPTDGEEEPKGKGDSSGDDGNEEKPSGGEGGGSSGGSDNNGGYGPVSTGGNNSTDFGPSPGSDGYGDSKDSPDNNGGICAI